MANLKKLSDYTLENEDVAEFEYNIKNSILDPYSTSVDKFVTYMLDQTESKFEKFIIILAFIFGSYGLSLAFLIYVTLKSDYQIMNEAQLCLTVQRRKFVKKKMQALDFYEAWEKGIGNERDDDNPMYVQKLEQYDNSRYSARKFGNSTLLTKGFVLKLFCTVVFIAGFTIGMTVIGKQNYDNLCRIRDSYNNSARIYQIFMFIDNMFM